MALVLADRVNETTTTAGLGTLTLAGAVAGYQSFSVIGNANTTYYTIVGQTTGEWEVGIGTYTSAGTTLSRDTVLSSSAGGTTKVTLSAGTKFVFCDYPAGRAVYLDTASNATIPGITLSGGTANGVAYLNASKVLTTGSALTYNGTGLGIGVASASNPLHIDFDGTAARIVRGSAIGFIYNTGTTSTSSFRIQSNTGPVDIYTASGQPITFSAETAEQMRLTSTGLGIGTSSPATKLDVVGTVKVTSSSTLSQYWNSASGAYTSWQNNGTTVGDIGTGNNAFSGGSTGDFGVTSRAGNLVFGQNSTEGMRLTSTGLCIGTSSPVGKLTVDSGSTIAALLRSSNASSYTSLRLYNDQNSSTRSLEIDYSGSSYSGALITGGPSGEQAAVGTTGAYPLVLYTSNTARMVIDSSGNVGVGLTPSAWNSAVKAIQINPSAAFWSVTNTQARIGNNHFYDSVGNFKYISTLPASDYQQFQGIHAWHVAPSGTAGTTITFTQAMTLTNGGYLGIGTTAPNYPLVVSSGGAAGIEISPSGGIASGGFIQSYNRSTSAYFAHTNYATSWYWNNGGTSLMTLDTSGNLLVGTTSTGYTSSNSTYYTPTAAYWINNHATGTASGTRYVGFGIGVNEVGSITQNGTTGVLFNITSDYRLKEFVAPVTGAGERIDALNPVEFDWKSDGSRARGFFAHEFQQVYASSVNGTKDAVDEEGNPVYQTMQASTAEVIADLVAEIKSLRVRLNALESK